MENILLSFNTKMNYKIYHQFLYWSVFRKRGFQLLIFLLLILYSTNIITSPLTSLGYSVLYLFVIIVANEIKYNMRIKTDKTQGLNSEMIVTLYEDKISFEFPKIENKMTLRYNQIYKVYNAKNFIAIYHTSRFAQIIPKTNLNSDNINIMLDVLKKNLDKRFK